MFKISQSRKVMPTKCLKQEGTVFLDEPSEQTQTQKFPAHPVEPLTTQGVMHTLMIERSKMLRMLTRTGKSEGILQKTGKGDAKP